MSVVSKFKVQRLFAIILGVITLAVSWFVTVDQPSILIGSFMVFWGLDGWIRE